MFPKPNVHIVGALSMSIRREGLYYSDANTLPTCFLLCKEGSLAMQAKKSQLPYISWLSTCSRQYKKFSKATAKNTIQYKTNKQTKNWCSQ